MPQERRSEELQEMRQHLLSTIAVYQEQGQSEDQAVASALQQFGGHKILGQKIVHAWRREKWKQWRDAPPEIILYGLFSFVISVSYYWLIFAGPEPWRVAMHHYLGDRGAAPYAVSILVGRAIFTPSWGPKIRERALFMLFLYAVIGAWDYVRENHLSNSHSPYLPVSLWKPVCNIALPLVWALVLWVCPIIRACRTRQTAG